MKTRGEIEAAVSERIGRFEREHMGHGPRDIHTHLLGDLIVVRLQGVLSAAEMKLVQSLSPGKGRDLLKQVRKHLIEIARPQMDRTILEATGVNVISMHHDMSTVTGEKVLVFVLGKTPEFRESKAKHT